MKTILQLQEEILPFDSVTDFYYSLYFGLFYGMVCNGNPSESVVCSTRVFNKDRKILLTVRISRKHHDSS